MLASLMGLSWSKRFGIVQGTCTFDQQNGIAAWGMPESVEHHPALDPSGRAYSRVGPTTFFLNGGEMPGEETRARLAARRVTIEVAPIVGLAAEDPGRPKKRLWGKRKFKRQLSKYPGPDPALIKKNQIPHIPHGPA